MGDESSLFRGDRRELYVGAKVQLFLLRRHALCDLGGHAVAMLGCVPAVDEAHLIEGDDVGGEPAVHAQNATVDYGGNLRTDDEGQHGCKEHSMLRAAALATLTRNAALGPLQCTGEKARPRRRTELGQAQREETK